MTPALSPTVRRRRLGIELRRLREAAGLTLEDVGRALEWSRSKASRIETGRVAVRARDVADLAALYGADQEYRERLVTLSRESRQQGWWHAYEDVLTEGFEIYVGLEAEAAGLHAYVPDVVPGLLQTEDYAREITRTTLLRSIGERVERVVELRMARQRRLEEEPLLELWAVLGEAALRCLVGNRLMRLQLERLVEVAAWPHVTLQVVPFAAGPHLGMGQRFSILRFAGQGDPEVVSVQQPSSNLYLEQAEKVREYNLVFDHLQAKGLDPDRSAAFISSIAKELG